MTHKEAIEYLEKADVTVYQEPKTKTAEALEMAIKALEDSRWIPVTERLPEEDGDYLVTSYTYDKSKVYVATRLFTDGKWFFCGEDIVAWMELPKPYKEGADNGKE